MRDHIVELSPTGRILKTFGRRGTQPGQFMAPWGVAVDAHGDVYVSEAPGYSLSPASSPQPRRIQEVSPTGQPLAQIADATTGREAPCGIAIDAQGNLDVANFAGGQIMSFSPSLRRLGVIRTGDAWPCGIGLDAQGNIYVSLGTTEDIAKYAPNGTLLRTLGPRHAVDPPFGLALDTQGNVYAIDMGQDQIIKLSPAGAVLFHRGKFGAKRGQFSFNESQFLGVAVDHDGNVYVSDPGNHRVQKFSSSGQPLAVWK
jgi:sugar lactone lactonase YvrE